LPTFVKNKKRLENKKNVKSVKSDQNEKNVKTFYIYDENHEGKRYLRFSIGNGQHIREPQHCATTAHYVGALSFRAVD